MFTAQDRKEHPLCVSCRFRSQCKLVPLSRTYCEPYEQSARDEKENGYKPSHHLWGGR